MDDSTRRWEHKCSFQDHSLSLPWKGTHVGLSAVVERGPSQGARSASTGPTWVTFQESPISHTSLKRSAQVALYCAHRTSTVSSCAFREQEGHLAASFSGVSVFPLLLGGGLVDPQMRASNEHLLSVRVPRAGGRPDRPLSSLQARLFYSLKDSRDCCCGHQSPVEILAVAKRRGPFLRVAQPVRRSVRR
jgi:hypothetical protein